MSQKIQQANIFGRLGTGIGRGLAEQVPKEIERNRLASGLKALGEQKGNTPFQNFSGLVGVAHEYPQVVQSGSDLLRQQSIIDSIKRNEQPAPPVGEYKPLTRPSEGPKSATRPESTEAALKPYIPPGGAEQENMARQRMAAEPHVYPNIESARQAVANEVSGNVQESNAKLGKRKLEQEVQDDTENRLKDEIQTLGAKVPGKAMSKLQQKAVEDVRSGELSPDEAKVKYGKEADEMSRAFSNIISWGNMSVITKNPKDVIQAMDTVRDQAKKGGYRKEAADSMIADVGVTPQFAYASMYPVNEIKPLNDELKEIPNIKPRIEKVPGLPGLGGLGLGRPNNVNSAKETEKIAPILARAMGPHGSPLSICYELEKKGYDTNVFKKYLQDNEENLNLTSEQKDELGKPQPSFFGWLNDWWLKSFSGVK
jgi:hypothetical protein